MEQPSATINERWSAGGLSAQRAGDALWTISLTWSVLSRLDALQPWPPFQKRSCPAEQWLIGGFTRAALTDPAPRCTEDSFIPPASAATQWEAQAPVTRRIPDQPATCQKNKSLGETIRRVVSCCAPDLTVVRRRSWLLLSKRLLELQPRPPSSPELCSQLGVLLQVPSCLTPSCRRKVSPLSSVCHNLRCRSNDNMSVLPI